MNSKSCKAAVVAIAWAAFPLTALAAQSSQVESHRVRPPPDPNQKICQDITVIGSRLATKRICATRAEWEQKRRDDKDTIDEIQRSPCLRDESGNCGGH